MFHFLAIRYWLVLEQEYLCAFLQYFMELRSSSLTVASWIVGNTNHSNRTIELMGRLVLRNIYVKNAN